MTAFKATGSGQRKSGPLFLFFFASALLVAIYAANTLPAFSIPEETLAKVEAKYGEMAKRRMLSLAKLMNTLADADEMTKIEEVNRFFNQVPYLSDQKNWNEQDYWATRTEFLGKFAGDCEDYATAKYFTLKQLGVPTEKLFITYAKSLTYKQAHMVLTYFQAPGAIPLVLDNYEKRVLPATQRKDLVPVYSFNGDDLYLAKQRGLGKKVPSSLGQNQKWEQLQNDIRSNKI